MGWRMRAPSIIRTGGLSTHAAKLERWLGVEEVEDISRSMKNWYGAPIAVGGTPGLVYAKAGGDFCGPIEAGGFANYTDHLARRTKLALKAMARAHSRTMNVGSIPDLAFLKQRFKEQGREFNIVKGSIAQARYVDNWFHTGYPIGASATTNPGSAPGGAALDVTHASALKFENAPSGQKTFFLGGETRLGSGTHGRNTLLYDRLWTCDKAMNSTLPEAVTGVPTRYQSTTNTNDDWAGNNFLFATSRQTLAATAHNYAGCLYTDESGNLAAALPSFAGRASSITGGFDHNTDYDWFMPLAAGDMGIKDITVMQLDAAVATGNICMQIGHPIGWLPCLKGQLSHVTDGIFSSLSITRIFDSACLTIMSNQYNANSSNITAAKFATVQA